MALTFVASQVRCDACGIMYDPIAAAASDKDEIPCAYYPARHAHTPPDPHTLVPARNPYTGEIYRNSLGDPILIRKGSQYPD